MKTRHGSFSPVFAKPVLRGFWGEALCKLLLISVSFLNYHICKKGNYLTGCTLSAHNISSGYICSWRIISLGAAYALVHNISSVLHMLLAHNVSSVLHMLSAHNISSVPHMLLRIICFRSVYVSVPVVQDNRMSLVLWLQVRPTWPQECQSSGDWPQRIESTASSMGPPPHPPANTGATDVKDRRLTTISITTIFS